MERAVAVKAVDILASGRELGALDILSHEIVEESERRAFRRKLGEIMCLYTDLLVSVVHQYPDLDPDRPATRASEKSP
jgi:hypothetical protein